MIEWKPISLQELNKQIKQAEEKLSDEQLNFWKIIKITPEKWSEKEQGQVGEGFWVVAIFENKAIWYNDIEDGFNISVFSNYGHIDEYYCNQDELEIVVDRLFNSGLTTKIT